MYRVEEDTRPLEATIPQDEPRGALREIHEAPAEGSDGALRGRLGHALAKAREGLAALQHDDGHWCAELEGDTILESEYVLALHFLGQAEGLKIAKAAEYVRRSQLPGGGWANYPEGQAEVSTSVKAYLVLKLAGDDPAAPHMERARRQILELGGIDACNSFTKIYLAICGEYEWWHCPAVVPEMMLLPRWFYFNIYAMSSWSRAIVVPLSVIWAHRPSHPLPEHARISELRLPRGERPSPLGGAVGESRFWTYFFELINFAFKGAEKLGLWAPWRRHSLRRAERWILKRLEKSDGLGAIFPPIVNTLVALRCLGYPLDHPVMREQMHELEKLEIEDEDTLRLQPCKSPVWDTALALNAMIASGLEKDDPRVLDAARWLLEKEVREPGDWRMANPDGPVGGWYFEYANEFYPDCDDTAEVLKVLAQVRFPDSEEDEQRREAIERGLAWLLSMQNRDGGWAAFDKDCDREILTYIPFADHNAMIDPSTCDITSRCLEVLGLLDGDRFPKAARRGLAFVYANQEEDGSWYGRWGCNYLYGTWLVLQGLRAIGEDLSGERFERAGRWLREHQNADGGWGELPLSYDDPSQCGRGPSTAAQTAWALLGLDALGQSESEAFERGIDHLIRTQRADGTWCDEPWTGTGFPKVFYLRYHLYATYFPLLALATCVERQQNRRGRELREQAA